jgi:1-acyl-sn-glycerol-3-phosphate acyltransferase
MHILRSILFAIVFYPGSLVGVLRALPAALTGSLAVRERAVDWARYHRWCCRWLLGIRSRVEGAIPQGPVLIAAKHQSMFETVDLVVILDKPAMVLKQELGDMPLWGRAARAYGAIPVARDGSASALRGMLRAARAAVDEGRSILIFPEGTRVAPGEQPPLKSGFAGLYSHLKLPVVPVAVDSGRLWPRNSFLKRAGFVTVRFGEPIPPGLPRAEIEARVHAAINVLDN